MSGAGLLRTLRSHAVRPLRPVAVSLAQRWIPGRRAVVLMYHRVADMPFDPWRLGVAPDRFDEQLEALTKHFRVISLSELADALDRGEVPSRTVVITFDDGYKDVLEHGKPTLEKYGAPATVFVASGYVGSGRNFWWDVVERAAFAPNRPQSGPVELANVTADWSTPSADLYMSLWRQLHPLPDAERRPLVDQLAARAGVNGDVLTMTEDELRALAAGGLVDIGGHTVTHPALTFLPPDGQLAEMRDSREQLEQLIGRPVTSFCFPHGEFTAESIALTREAGYRETCVSVEALVREGTDRFEIPRWRVTNLYADVLIWELSRFFRRG